MTELKEMKKNAESLAKEKEELKCTVNEKEEHVQRCEVRDFEHKYLLGYYAFINTN